MLLCKALRQLKGVFLTVFRYIVKETAAVVVRLYNAVTVYTELLCSFNQFGIVFAALIDRCFLVLDCTGRSPALSEDCITSANTPPLST